MDNSSLQHFSGQLGCVDNALPSVFIDSHYDSDYQEEIGNFTQNTQKLLEFAQTKLSSPFDTKNIESVLPELKKLKSGFKWLMDL